jgi:hypothetical protein
MIIGTTMLQQVVIGVMVFLVSLLGLTIVAGLLVGNTATGLGYLKSLAPLFLIIGALWVGLGIAVRLLIWEKGRSKKIPAGFAVSGDSLFYCDQDYDHADLEIPLSD